MFLLPKHVLFLVFLYLDAKAVSGLSISNIYGLFTYVTERCHSPTYTHTKYYVGHRAWIQFNHYSASVSNR